MTPLQLMAHEQGPDTELDAIENPYGVEPESLGSIDSEPFLAGSEDLLGLALAMKPRGYSVAGIRLTDENLVPLEPELAESLEAEIVELLRSDAPERAWDFWADELRYVYISSIDLRDRKGKTGRIQIMQDGLVLVDQETAIRPFLAALRTIPARWDHG